MSRIAFFILVLACACAPSRAGNWSEIVPLTRVHAHNDYEHKRPLWDALENGFCSVEADVHLRDGELLVAHDASETRRGRTLEKMYLRELKALVRSNHGRVFPGGPTVILLIDIKTAAEPTYRKVEEALGKYREMLTVFHGDQVETNAVTVIISGNRPREFMRAEKERLAAYDGRIADLDENLPASFEPLVSNSWEPVFTWNGQGEFPVDQKAKLRALTDRVHAQGKLFRLWGTPDDEAVWSALYDAGVDLINTDRLSEAAKFVRQREGK